MGQKVHPYIFRILQGKNWKSNWFANKRDFAKLLHQDLFIKKFIRETIKDAGIAEILIERTSGKTAITIETSRPGIVIGREGSAIDDLKEKLSQKFQTRDIEIKVEEIRKPELVAALIADGIARQIERRIPYRRAVKQALERTMEVGALGCKIKIGGRLNGADIARKELYKKGKIPLHTIRSDIDYASERAATSYGAIGIKVWVYKGEVKESQESGNGVLT